MLQILNLNPRLNFIRRENCKFADIVGVGIVVAAAFFRLLLQQNTWQQSMNVQTKAFFFLPNNAVYIGRCGNSMPNASYYTCLLAV